ncbi:MAG: hypothetical protein CVV56_00820 [Tenericutes bacterium HGW-Tenericutes-1]|jgi:hypothetical protein|nr:MAG: hypothetical protein CVV56_00820 [Tenericutes bacterium HGW-Tenericutes-1]
MSKKIQLWIFTGFYLLNLIAISLVIILVKPNPDVSILLSIYMLILTGFFSYATSHYQKKK